jgi:hypothetical protein
MSSTAGLAGPELPLSRPTLGATHPEIASQGQAIIKEIIELSNPDNKWHEGHCKGLLDALPGLFDIVVDFISATLAIRGPNEVVAYWAEQTYKIVWRLEVRSPVMVAPLATSTPPP